MDSADHAKFDSLLDRENPFKSKKWVDSDWYAVREYMLVHIRKDGADRSEWRCVVHRVIVIVKRESMQSSEEIERSVSRSLGSDEWKLFTLLRCLVHLLVRAVTEA